MFRAALGTSLASLVLLTALSTGSSNPVTPREVIQLFNGKDLSNFYTYLGAPAKGEKPYGKGSDPEKVFTVHDGMIHISGKVFGALTTEKDYENYHLVVEFKWGTKTWPPREDKTMDSGILLHCVGDDGAANGVWMESIECQIIEGGTGDFILVGGKNRPTMTVAAEERSGQLYYKPGAAPVTQNSRRINWYGRDPAWKDVKGFRGGQDVEKPAGEWNTVECICDGDRITNIVNGKVVNAGVGASHTKGKIQFQSEGAEIFFRRIELRPLRKAAPIAQAARVFDWPWLPDDSRLGPPRHLDNPASFSPAFKDAKAWEERARDLRQQVLVANGLWPLPEKTALNPVIHGKIDRDEYTIEKVFFASYPGHYVSGNLYRPKASAGRQPAGGKWPAVLSPHGHWQNGRFFERSEAEAKKEIDSGAEKTMESARYPLQARCAMLARLGCVVFHYDMVGNADSTQIKHRDGFLDADAELRLQSFMGLQTWNSVRALDFLTSLPDVDPKRVAVTGASGGGTQTFVLCAIDDRPAVSFPAVMVSVGMQGGCICENCSYLRLDTNNIELAALFAPKPQAMTGADDWTRDIETRGLPELKKVYGLYGAEGNVMAKYYPFPHNYNQVSRELMYNWLNKHLKLGYPEPISEKPFMPVPWKELSVFDDQHPRPKDATDAAGLRKHLTQASDKQMAELAKKPEDYRRVVGAALRVMIDESLPESVELVPSTFSQSKGDGYTIHKSVLTRQGAQLPAIGLVPANWNKEIVIWVHPEGKGSLFQGDGAPVPAVRQLLDKQFAVLSADLFLTGEFHLPGRETPVPAVRGQERYAGYRYGYNRSLLAGRVHDILTLMAQARRLKAKAVHLVAVEKAGPAALLARALAGDAVSRAVIDLNGFDFDQVTSTTDDMMLPGALKYGGIMGFVPLCTSGETVLLNAAKSARVELAAGAKGVSLREGQLKPEELVKLLIK